MKVKAAKAKRISSVPCTQTWRVFFSKPLCSSYHFVFQVFLSLSPSLSFSLCFSQLRCCCVVVVSPACLPSCLGFRTLCRKAFLVIHPSLLGFPYSLTGSSLLSSSLSLSLSLSSSVTHAKERQPATRNRRPPGGSAVGWYCLLCFDARSLLSKGLLPSPLTQSLLAHCSPAALPLLLSSSLFSSLLSSFFFLGIPFSFISPSKPSDFVGFCSNVWFSTQRKIRVLDACAPSPSSDEKGNKYNAISAQKEEKRDGQNPETLSLQFFIFSFQVLGKR